MKEIYYPFEQKIVNKFIELFENKEDKDWFLGVPIIELMKEILINNSIYITFKKSDDDIDFDMIELSYEIPPNDNNGHRIFHVNKMLIMDLLSFMAYLKTNRLIHFVNMDNDSINAVSEKLKKDGYIIDGKKITPNIPTGDGNMAIGITPMKTQRYSLFIKYIKDEFGFDILTTIFPSTELKELAKNSFETFENKSLKEARRQTLCAIASVNKAKQQVWLAWAAVGLSIITVLLSVLLPLNKIASTIKIVIFGLFS